MLLSHTHQFIFRKTRKSASTSVEMLLEPFCRKGAAVVDQMPAAEDAPLRNPFAAVHSLFHHHAKQIAACDRGVLARCKQWFGNADIVSLSDRLSMDRFAHFERLIHGLTDLIADRGLRIVVALLPWTMISKQAGTAYDVSDLYDTGTADIVRDRHSWAFEGVGYSPRLENSALPPARFQGAEQSRVAIPDIPVRSST